jgi:DNA topoisomerase VI subunit A
LNILLTYKLGGFSSLESQRFCVPDIQWLGLHSTDIELLELKGQYFDSADVTALKRLSTYSFIKNNHRYAQEVSFMKSTHTKVELQSLNNLGYDFISYKYLKNKILTKQYF